MTDHIYDVVVVGAGIAGALIAQGLAKANIDVLIIEAGRALDDEGRERHMLRENFANSDEEELFAPFAQDLAPQWHGYKNQYYTTDVDDPSGDQFAAQYLRLVGGSALGWLGTSLRMCPSDFRMKSIFSRGRDWPISYSDLEHWYGDAEHELGVAGNPDAELSLGITRTRSFPMPAILQSFADRYVISQTQSLIFEGKAVQIAATPQARNSEEGYNGRQLCEGYGSCVPLCPVGAKYDPLIHLRRALLTGADLWPETIVTNLVVSPEGSITSAECRLADGTVEHVRARVFVIAANGIETPKLLLMSNGHSDAGLANGSGQVGRNLMDHPEKHSCAILGNPIFPYRGPQSTSGIEVFRDGSFRRRRAAFRTALRNDGWRIVNGAPLVQSNRAERGTIVGFVDQERLIGSALREALEYTGRRQFALQSVIEMLPNPENRISLSPHAKDETGLPRPQITFSMSNYERRGIAAAAALHAEIFAAVASEPKHTLIDLQDDPFKADAAGSHIMGTTVMGFDGKTSVVDPNCRAHDHQNLFLAGSSVFPTGATSNPTLTISALALRLVPTIIAFLGEADFAA